VFFERLLAAQDQPLFADVRRTSVMNMAAQYQVDVDHTRHVAELALGMFDELAQLGLHDGDPGERELLWAASMLHDIGMSIDYDDHHKHSRYLILNGGLPGFSPVETAIIAQSARYHRKGMPIPGPLAPLFGQGDAERLNRCAALLRLAEDLERSRDQLVRRTSIALRDGEVELRLIVEGNAAVPRWAAGRERELFARAFHRGLAVAA
jgi:exopolyphosphatase/guanosine-5'-triphosphate,3'-diphosphate pyrophosphatase